MRMTAAMAAKVVDRVWELAELMDAALAEPEGEKPVAKPLAPLSPAPYARVLPGDRGWLRLIGGTAIDGKNGKPRPGPGKPPAAPLAAKPTLTLVEPAADPTGQLDLLAWKPKVSPARPLPMGQLSLFGDE
jgi:hypothetical protein